MSNEDIKKLLEERKSFYNCGHTITKPLTYMTQAEKLTKLIELAWANGYGWKPVQWSAGLPRKPAEAVVQDIGLFNETIIFDHDFIKALCKAKYHNTATDIATFDEAFHQEVYDEEITIDRNETLRELATNTNRIDYLYGEFCE